MLSESWENSRSHIKQRIAFCTTGADWREIPDNVNTWDLVKSNEVLVLLKLHWYSGSAAVLTGETTGLALVIDSLLKQVCVASYATHQACPDMVLAGLSPRLWKAMSLKAKHWECCCLSVASVLPVQRWHEEGLESCVVRLVPRLWREKSQPVGFYIPVRCLMVK